MILLPVLSRGIPFPRNRLKIIKTQPTVIEAKTFLMVLATNLDIDLNNVFASGCPDFSNREDR